MQVLIAGGTGLVGLALAKELKKNGCDVAFLSRKNGHSNGFRCFEWQPQKGYLDAKALEGRTVLINLAGANVGDKRWNPAYKKEILESRTLSTRLLYNTLRTQPNYIKVFINASAVGYYGCDTGDTVITESSTQGMDFLAHVVGCWEKEAAPIADLGIRLVILRIGVVMSAQGGAYVSMRQPVSLGIGAQLGRGLQWLPWIHIADMCNIFDFCIRNNTVNGVYNAVAPIGITNRMFTYLLAQHLKKPYFMPAVPAFVLKVILGEFAASVLGGQNVSAQKIEKAGFKFLYPMAENAIRALESNIA